jgi:ComF family protein
MRYSDKGKCIQNVNRKHSLLGRIINAAVDALFPARCLVCRSFFHPPLSATAIDLQSFSFDGLMAPFLCYGCRADFIPVQSPICLHCGLMFESREGTDHLCGDCITSSMCFRSARAAGAYRLSLQTAIHCFKFQDNLHLAKPLGRLLFAAFVRYWDPKSFDWIIPVPLHSKRFRKRGFNQAFLLIREWPQLAQWSKSGIIKIEKEFLTRNRCTRPQIGLGREQRINNIKGAFDLKPSSPIEDKNILLIDDVYTTGSTVNECAQVLLSKGAARVDVLTLARAM